MGKVVLKMKNRPEQRRNIRQHLNEMSSDQQHYKHDNCLCENHRGTKEVGLAHLIEIGVGRYNREGG